MCHTASQFEKGSEMSGAFPKLPQLICNIVNFATRRVLLIYISFIILLGEYLMSGVLKGEATTMSDEIDGFDCSIHRIYMVVFTSLLVPNPLIINKPLI